MNKLLAKCVTILLLSSSPAAAEVLHCKRLARN